MGDINKRKKLAQESCNFGISDLPDDMLEHIVSFLSLNEAVRTCVLSKNWSYIWKFVPTLHISDTVDKCNSLIDNFLRGHGNTAIIVCDIELTNLEKVEMHDMIDTWIFHIVNLCHVQELKVISCIVDDFLKFRDQALISKHLRRLELDKVRLQASIVDFSTCPALEEIDLMFCWIEANYIISKSLKRLIAVECEFDSVGARTHISVPNLIFLKLTDIWHYTPLFEAMPSLEVGYVSLGEDCLDYCNNNKSWGCDNVDCGFGCTDGYKYDSILLEGLSNASYLELLSEPSMFIFDRDLRRCPTFRNLRTLILNEWFLVANLHGLARVLHNSPILEELNLLLLEEPKEVVESNGDHYQVEHPLLETLKEVKVNCERQYMWVQEIINILITFGISPEIIIVKESQMHPDVI
ncbi:hypothetical protein CFC21_085869 [Triticum aestivum]|uniref:F-box domain-containing protein n=3 Tax=Triticum TaxID=4564 RepID=A0A9R0YCS9_TRITD|nr:putative FBD-associated F-box protein At5g56820 [Triticum aestivum]KAF7081978.1 hypothetical protein CFC21_085869 [Triticum aestivum]VAI52542.1 unnamed protein product [Triticum turgidum subsp. durum]